ncbi:hypothetical protein [Paeniglutamicibacter terrestris]|uniref:Uncharacterized protein n=1 Tax=Paeniglutamicibacter terrestris TaxID=2723403 RepID=A0ABX1G680_9MICC|nr:hypothetical protein [Paeniglutamicibacter terrestris]NKG21071.1 hypothetical protein [Paeniglutamicibacter terrestris]
MAEPEVDRRLWIKLSVDYFDNPKIDNLTDSAQLLHIGLIMRSFKQKKSGTVTARACKIRGDGPFRELVAEGLLIKVDSGTYRVHDYEKHQSSPDVIAKRKTAGARGGHTTNHVNRLIYDESCAYCQDDAVGNLDWIKDPNVVEKGV